MTPRSALTLEDGDEIIDAELASVSGRLTSSLTFGDESSTFDAALASTSDAASASTGTLVGKRRLNGSAFAGGHLALRLASGEGVVVVVVVDGLIVEK